MQLIGQLQYNFLRDYLTLNLGHFEELEFLLKILINNICYKFKRAFFLLRYLFVFESTYLFATSHLIISSLDLFPSNNKECKVTNKIRN